MLKIKWINRITGSTMLLLSVMVTSPVQAQVDLSTLPQHPRLLLLKGEEKALMKGIRKDRVWNEMNNELLGEADRILATAPNERIKIGMRLLQVCREDLRRIFLLSYAYRTTGEKKYLDRAEAEMLKAASFEDWNPSHFLDVGEMTMAMAIGYDWLYPNLSPSSRATIREAIVEKGLKPSFDTTYNWFVDAVHNWNQVCHAGVTYGALVVAEQEPELAKRIIERTVDKIKLPMHHYAPNGAYPEGPSYWDYGTSFNIMTIHALQKALGTDFGLSQLPGFMQTGDYALHMITPLLNQFSYMDNSVQAEFTPTPFWFYSQTKDPACLYQQMGLLREDTTKKYLNYRLLPMLFIWGAGAPMEHPVAPKELVWAGRGDNPVCVMRSAWGDPNALFVGVKMGAPGVNHGHMDVGSFIFEANGVRWASDLGGEGYNSLETQGVQLWEMHQQSQRWDVYRYNNRTHNTLTFNDKLQHVDQKVEILELDKQADHPYVSMDLTPVYKGQVNKAIRGVSMVDNQALVVEDHIEAGEFYTRLRWTLVTETLPTLLEENVVLLEKEGKKCYLEVDAQGPIRWKIHDAVSDNSYDSPNPGVKIVAFDVDLKRNQAQNIRVSFIPNEHKEIKYQQPPSLK